MKVLDLKPWTKEVECKGCKSKLELESSDIKACEWESGDCDHTSYSYTCSVCGTDNDLKYTDFPQGVADGAIKRWRNRKRKSR